MSRTNIGGKFYIAVDGSNDPVPANTDLTLVDYQGFTWLEVPDMGNHGDSGVNQNIVSYSTWGNRLSTHIKGEAQGQQPEIRFLDKTSTGMSALKAAADVTDLNNYPTKLEWPDGAIEYNRGIFTAPTYAKGGNEDFAEAVFTFAINQEPIFE